MSAIYESNTTSVVNQSRNTNGMTGTLQNNGFTHHLFIINVGAIDPGTTLTVSIVRRGGISANFQTVLTSAAYATVGVYHLQIGPGFPDTTNVSANTILGDRYRIEWAIAGGGAVTFSIAPFSI